MVSISQNTDKTPLDPFKANHWQTNTFLYSNEITAL